MSADDARKRFADATQRHLTAPLVDKHGGALTLRHVDADTWHATIEPLWQSALDGRAGVDVRQLLDDDQRARLADLESTLARLQHYVLFERDGEFVGGYWGAQDTEGRYAMVVSVFAKALHGRGLYSAWLPRVVAAAQASGFREMYSRHRVDNNAILVPKLKAGFFIAGFEIAPRWGLTVLLRKYLVDSFLPAHAYRVDGAGAEALRQRGLQIP